MGSITPAQVVPDNEDTLFSTIDEVIRRRARTHKDGTLISYPFHETDFVDYTGERLDLITRCAAHTYLQALIKICPGLTSLSTSHEKSEGNTCRPSDITVALVGISSLEYYVSFLALQRLGITTMFISPRLADQGHSHLLNKTQCCIAIASGSSYSTLQRIRNDDTLLANDLSLLPMINYDFVKSCVAGNVKVDGSIDSAFLNAGKDQGFIIHSGGTTGLPKPVPLKVSAWLLQAHRMVCRNPPANTLSTLPLFHSFGLATLLRGLVGGTRLSLLNAARPVTAAIIQEGLSVTGSQALVTVPYTMKFLAEADGGLEILGQLKQVINAGSAIPDDLGDKVVAAGANIFHFYGQTECGALMEPPEDRLLWSWVAPLPHAAPFLKFEAEGDGNQNLYHLFVLPGLKQKVFSDQPDGSYATKDLFQRHPTDPNLWKFVARKDDIIVLVNGEKADPIPIEDAVMTNPNVKIAVAFGAGHDSLGLIIIRAEKSSSLSHEQYLETISPEIELGNSRVPAYARLSSDMVIIKDSNTPFPATDKSTVIRAMFLKSFEGDIESLYSAKDSQKFEGVAGGLMPESQVMDIVSKAVRDQLVPSQAKSDENVDQRGIVVEFENTTDFFDLGLDSLQASNIRKRLLREVDLCGGSLALNVIFDHPNVELLTKYLLEIRSGQIKYVNETKLENLARDMIERYSRFDVARPGTEVPVINGECVLLTGATGQVGAHILSQLLRRDDVAKVVCLVRDRTMESGLSRITNVLQGARLDEGLSKVTLQKLAVYPGDLADPSGRFGLTDMEYDTLRNSVTTIIHNSWSVNFNMSLQSFELQSIRPTFHLIQLALGSPLLQKPKFTFISSIASVLRGALQPNEKLLEGRYGWERVGEMGYGQSKWVAEGICAAAVEKTGLSARVARLGQIVGDTQHGHWKAAEAYPTLIQSALTIGALPFIEPSSSGAVHDQCYWLPVDTAAAGVVEIALHNSVTAPNTPVFHVTNSEPISWNDDFLPAVKRALQPYGIRFETLPQRQWLQRLVDSDLEVEKNPPKKLLAFFQGRYGNLDDSGEPALDMAQACAVAPFLGEDRNRGLADSLTTKFVKYWVEECWGHGKL